MMTVNPTELLTDAPPLSAFISGALLDAIPFPILVYRPDGLLHEVNVAAERLWGSPREQIIGRVNLFEVTDLFSWDVLGSFNQALGGETVVTPPVFGDMTRSVERAALATTQIWTENLLIPLHDSLGRVAYILIFQRDVTETTRTRHEIEAAVIEIEVQRQTIASLEAAHHEIQKQKLTIQALSTPIIEVWDRVLTLPVVGHVTEERAAAMTEQLLEAILRTQAAYTILDLTAVAGIDTTTVDTFLRIMRAIGLLGAQAIVVGISPTVAQVMTTLGVDMGQLVIRRNLRQALSYCMVAEARRTGRHKR